MRASDHQGLSLIALVLVSLLPIASLRHQLGGDGNYAAGSPSLPLRCAVMLRRAWLAGGALGRLSRRVTQGCHLGRPPRPPDPVGEAQRCRLSGCPGPALAVPLPQAPVWHGVGSGLRAGLGARTGPAEPGKHRDKHGCWGPSCAVAVEGVPVPGRMPGTILHPSNARPSSGDMLGHCVGEKTPPTPACL